MDWWRGAVMYQIYPRSFADSNGDGVGDLPGVTARLDHVASLGVDGIWLSPFYPSPMADFGYDVSDYRAVDPLFGTLADFDALIARAHDVGLKVIIDQVWSHSSDRHPWFAASRADRHGAKGDWYVWADAKPDGTPPNNWLSVFGGPAWTWCPRRRQYYFHNFLSAQPDLNLRNPSVRAEILDIARFWLDRGVDGFRLDVVNLYMHDAELRDNPPAGLTRPPARAYLHQRHIYDQSRPETLDFVSDLRALCDAYDARMLVGEITDDDPLARQREYTDGPNRLHTAYSFFLLAARRADPALFHAAHAAWHGASGWPSWSLGNHDVARFPTRLAAPDGDPRRIKVLLAILLCLRGTAFLYQGDELGLPQAQVPFERLRDPFAIATYTGDAFRDGARTPMPWTADGAQAGFSDAAETWLPLDPAHRALAVAVQDADPHSVLWFTRRILGLRRAHPALRDGAVGAVAAPDGVLAFERTRGGERILCAFNLSGEAQTVALSGPKGARVLPSGLEGALDGSAIALPPHGGALVSLGS